ncbi:nuclear transport factor 2 family protein [Ramlibacter henchirensis]|uniref:Nuclear transport factor 2 family protein n=1 Tax=Ramlibacter henchirensis TaxID=204072 RepID=A0A4Z0BW32_9BURK|nr:nuclear transport factor 2 family protein [Ramlibacter henchirensis]TFZ02922.1 nuclear transport factor 2 family protein [Ramlibacter henchirensis]
MDTRINDDYSAERVADRLAIQDVMFRWCRAVDRLDFSAIKEVFHPDAIDDHGIYSGNVEGLVAWIRQRHEKIPFSMHQVSNMLIEFASPDSALAETYIWSVQRYSADGKASLAQLSGGAEGKPGGESDMFGAHRYIDRFERRDGLWKIIHRTVVMGWRTIVDVDPNGPQMLPQWTVARRDQEDFVFAERQRLGIR